MIGKFTNSNSKISTISISIVIPVYNEVEILKSLIEELFEEVYLKFEKAEFIVAEDGSTDGTKELLSDLKEVYPLKLVSSNRRKGYVKAFLDALKLADNEWIFFCDSSGKHKISDFWKLFCYINEADMITGYKKDRKDPFYRRVTTKVFNSLVRNYFDINTRDINSGFRLIKKVLIDAIICHDYHVSPFVGFEFTIKAKYAGFNVKEAEIGTIYRPHGVSKGLSINRIPNVVIKTLLKIKEVKKSAKTLRTQ